MTKRASTSDTFDPPVDVRELNTGDREWPSWVSPDRCRIYFNRQAGSFLKIYVAERAP
jgi:hypothetical protein